jgi:hypothetical protein
MSLVGHLYVAVEDRGDLEPVLADIEHRTAMTALPGFVPDAKCGSNLDGWATSEENETEWPQGRSVSSFLPILRGSRAERVVGPTV